MEHEGHATVRVDPRTGGRNHPSSHDTDSARYRIEFFRPLGRWLESRRPEARHGRILDFGCGDLLIAAQLDGVWVVDGYDESPTAREAARATQRDLRTGGVVFDRLDDIPTGAYDAVIVNSLFQYVEGPDAARGLFATVGRLLATDAPIGIVVTDAVSDGSNRFADLVDLLRFTFGTCGPRIALVGIVQGIRSGRPSKRHRIAQADLERAAEDVGLRLERLPASLTRFRRRATFVLRHVDHPRAPG